jgi:Predicted integral membrane protein (DUF2269)
MLQLLLLLHVLGAIIVFGPTFAFPIIARQAQGSPPNGHFAAVVIDLIERRIVIPGAIIQGITGVGLILVLNANLTSAAYRWLVAGIVLYIITITFAVVWQAPAAARMVELTVGPPPGAAPAGGQPTGPSPELLATAKKLQRGGIFLAVMIILIVTLMVTKPGV